MAVTGNTELLVTKNDVILEVVQRELQEKSKIISSGSILDYSSRVGKGMKSIAINKADSFTPLDRASAVAGTPSNLTFDKDIINLDKRKYLQWIIDVNDEIESSVAVELEYAKRAASGFGRQFDADAFAVMEAIASHVAQGVPAAATRDDILAMREELMYQNADLDNVVIWCSVGQEHNLLKVPEFSQMNYYNDEIIKSGVLGRLYGIPVIVSNLITAGQIYMLDKEAIGYAFQRNVQMDEEKALDYGTGAMKKVMDCKYGIAGLQLGVDSGKGTDAVLAAESPLCVKLQ